MAKTCLLCESRINGAHFYVGPSPLEGVASGVFCSSLCWLLLMDWLAFKKATGGRTCN